MFNGCRVSYFGKGDTLLIFGAYLIIFSLLLRVTTFEGTLGRAAYILSAFKIGITSSIELATFSYNSCSWRA